MEILTYLLTQGILSCSYFKNLQKFHSRHLVIGYLVSGTVATRSSAIAEGPRDASCQLKSCQFFIGRVGLAVVNQCKQDSLLGWESVEPTGANPPPGALPLPPGALPLDPTMGLSSPRPPVRLCPTYLQILATPLIVRHIPT